ncbi:hypothetical protein PI87_02680 [Ralstonia sp. A12]|uniref:hypothetical protein n=1 Tax=Ralstonia sp. A12 TaxID=1217052 RepID=UPI0005732217|nr:hypothetical protein [Ralstonia sp. A12]KHK58667.1 hypothetical protein PI87_02680 [Ralstonia sp. A12]
MNPRGDLSALDADSPTRSAALLLHALSEADRHWLLQRLRPEESAMLGPMLAELRQMGIPAERSLVSSALHEVPFLDGSDSRAGADTARGGMPGPLSATTDADRIVWLKQAAPVALAEVFRAEPPQAIAYVLLLADWPWRAQLLTRMGPSIRGRVETAITELQRDTARVRAASAFQASLLKHVCARLDAFMASKQWALLQKEGRAGGLAGPRDRFLSEATHRRAPWSGWLTKLRAWR